MRATNPTARALRVGALIASIEGARAQLEIAWLLK